MCASDPVETVLPCYSNKFMTGNQTQSHWAEGRSAMPRGCSYLHSACHSPSPTRWVCGPPPVKGRGRAERCLLLYLKAISLADGCFEAVRLLEYQLCEHEWKEAMLVVLIKRSREKKMEQQFLTSLKFRCHKTGIYTFESQDLLCKVYSVLS